MMLQEFLGLGQLKNRYELHTCIFWRIFYHLYCNFKSVSYWPLHGESKLYGGRDSISDFLGLIGIGFTTASCSPWNGSCIEENLVITLRMLWSLDLLCLRYILIIQEVWLRVYCLEFRKGLSTTEYFISSMWHAVLIWCFGLVNVTHWGISMAVRIWESTF